MRLGGPILEKYDTPAQWAAIVRALGYRAAFCPIGTDAPDDLVRAYASAACEADVAIAEVGIESVDDSTRRIVWIQRLATNRTARIGIV